MIAPSELPSARPMELGVEELEPMVEAWSWSSFWQGFGIGIGIVGLTGAGIGIGLAIAT